MSYFYILLTILLTVYGQITIKWQVAKAGVLPQTFYHKITFLAHLLLNPWIISALLAALLASFSWMAALTKLQLSYAYPFMSLSFVLVMILSMAFFGEAFTLVKAFGVTLIILGVSVTGFG